MRVNSSSAVGWQKQLSIWIVLSSVLHFCLTTVSDENCSVIVVQAFSIIQTTTTSRPGQQNQHQHRYQRAINKRQRSDEATASRTAATLISAASSTTSIISTDQRTPTTSLTENDTRRGGAMDPQKQGVSFSHVHLYVDEVQDLSVYKYLETKLNEFSIKLSSKTAETSSLTIEEKRDLWRTILQKDRGTTSAPSLLLNDLLTSSASPDTTFTPNGRDVIQQLIAGFGFRVTAARFSGSDSNTCTYLVTSRDPQGVQILVTAPAVAASSSSSLQNKSDGEQNKDTITDALGFFDTVKLDTFYRAHNNRQGIAVLAFLVDDVETILDRYNKLHPNLVSEYYAEHKVLEVNAYYQPNDNNNNENENLDPSNQQRTADTGTVLRFVQKQQQWSKDRQLPLPGLTPVEASFEDSSKPAYCDHWVSNVFSRTEFLDILHDTLSFSPKVDFNAGVVAAGEAQIESTVTGNDSESQTNDKLIALRDQSQVYLPINNALSSVGHVYGFLKELGQGVQHLASRVDDLVAFVQRGNDYRKITGEGFTFLRIPRSYYGILTVQALRGGVGNGGLSEPCAQAVFQVLRDNSLCAKDGAVDLELTREAIGSVLDEHLSGDNLLEEYKQNRDFVVETISKSRYTNLYSLLRDNLSEESYLNIVRNQILVDIQGEDLLYQIFTANILQRQPGEEAPFFEFIQRVCSECTDEKGCPRKVRPGCGGFGIRNFLTLFLSIEVSKAMQEVTDATEAGDAGRLAYAEAMVGYFTDQLNEANPILTEISDAMTEEGLCKENVLNCMGRNQVDHAKEWEQKMHAAAERKLRGNEKLMECSARYNTLMKVIREERNKSLKNT